MRTDRHAKCSLRVEQIERQVGRYTDASGITTPSSLHRPAARISRPALRLLRDPLPCCVQMVAMPCPSYCRGYRHSPTSPVSCKYRRRMVARTWYLHAIQCAGNEIMSLSEKNEFIIKAIFASPESGFDINYGLEQLLYAHADSRTIFD